MTLRVPAALLAALAALGLAVSMAVVPSTFIVDDVNYLVTALEARDGRVTVANTEGLTPSRELLFFDPTARTRGVTATPVASTAPPLYAPFAVPFLWMGWRGLVALNTLAYLATALIVFAYARAHAAARGTAWLAAAAFSLGGYALEYALGVWPQALSLFLCTSGIAAAGAAIDGGRAWVPAVSGVLLGLAAGVRYQNAAMVAVVAICIALLAERGRRAALVFVVAAALPLSASAIVNHARIDSWNPISKGPGYLQVPIPADAPSIRDPLVLFWSQLVDASARPRLIAPDIDSWYSYDPATGAHLMLGLTVKKAFLQSAPWAGLALGMYVLAWRPARAMPERQRRQLRLLSVVRAAVLLLFSLASVNRYDGLSFNQRYLLELLPLAAVAAAWALDALPLSLEALLAGVLTGVGIALAVLVLTPLEGGAGAPLWVARQLAILRGPLLLGAALVVLWSMALGRRRLVTATTVVVGACLGWGAIVHLGQDVATAQGLRRLTLRRTEQLARVLTDGSALVASGIQKDAVAPLLLDRDIVVVDVRPDEGRDAPVLIRELLARGRRVYLLRDRVSPEVVENIVSGLQALPVGGATLPLIELRARP